MKSENVRRAAAVATVGLTVASIGWQLWDGFKAIHDAASFSIPPGRAFLLLVSIGLLMAGLFDVAKTWGSRHSFPLLLASMLPVAATAYMTNTTTPYVEDMFCNAAQQGLDTQRHIEQVEKYGRGEGRMTESDRARFDACRKQSDVRSGTR